MAKCNCSGSTGSTYATVNRGYGCLSSVPAATGGIPYNCFLPPTNMSYYQNYPFYNGPCGSTNASGPSGFRPLFNPCFGCNNGDGAEAESETSGTSAASSGNCGCCYPCNPCCKPCCKKDDPCCAPAAALVTSSGTVTTTAGGNVPLTLSSTAVNSNMPMPLANLTGAISVVGDTVVFNCPGTYLVLLTVRLPSGVTYTGNIGLTQNSSAVNSSTQAIALTTGSYNGTTQSLVRANAGDTLSVTTSAALANATPTAGSIITLSIIRVA